MSDGVIEAQDSQGTLFGFDRVDEMLSQQKTPREIAMAAQAFGQEDDILVLRVQRVGAGRFELTEQPQFAS
jgi:serine phosphatase RsbU (regulator of sigma subunit)